MKNIVKASEPPSLTSHRREPHADYENYLEKADLRVSLLQEQGYICCYCNRRITARGMKIEHWKPRNLYPSLQLEYANLLASCLGGEGNPRHLQHCDSHKGDTLITIHPADANHNCELLVKYTGDGEIFSDSPTIDHDLDKVLNLNLQTLMNNRRAVVDGMLAHLRQRRPIGNWKRQFLATELDRWSSRNRRGQFPEYCHVVIHHLRKKLARMEKSER